MKKLVIAAALAAGSLLLFAPELLAQVATAPGGAVVVPPTSDGKVVIEYGGWISKALDLIVPALVAVVMWGLRKLPANIVAIIEMLRVEQLLKRAIDYGVNATKGATKDAKLEINVANKVLEAAGDYAAAQAPTLVEKMGGLEKLLQKLLARIEVTEAVSAASVNVPQPPPAAVSVAAGGSASGG